MIRSRLAPAWCALAAGCAAAVVVMVLGPFRIGGYLLAGVLLATAAARVVLPARACDGVAVRSRPMDVVLYVGLAAAVVVIVTEVRL